MNSGHGEFRPKHNKNQIRETMAEAGIPSASVAFISNHGNIYTEGISLSSSDEELAKNAMFGAASLSKPVFAFLVLKLIENSEDQFNLETKLNEVLPLAEFCKANSFKWDGTNENLFKDMTVGMALSHTTGLNLEGDKIELLFEPSQEYAYSNVGLFYLQKVMEKYTRKPLEKLAQEYVFGDDALKMKNSTFYRDYNLGFMTGNRGEPVPRKIYLEMSQDGSQLHYEVIGLDGELKKGTIPREKLPADFPKETASILAEKVKWLPILLSQTSAAGHTTGSSAVSVFSLFTTAHDYAIFVRAWMDLKKKEDKKEQNGLMTAAFKPVISMTTDKWANEFGVPKKDLEKLASGFTWELEIDDTGKKAVKAYKTGDMDPWRAWVAIDFEKDIAIIYFANSGNGHLLANQIVLPNVELEHAPNFFFTKWGFTREVEPHWEEKEKARMEDIVAYEHGYKLNLIPEDPSVVSHGTIYIKDSAAGLEYKVFTPYGELKTNTIAWEKFPKDFPRDPAVIASNREKYLSNILAETFKEGHTRTPRTAIPGQQVLSDSVVKLAEVKISPQNITGTTARMMTIELATIPTNNKQIEPTKTTPKKTSAIKDDNPIMSYPEKEKSAEKNETSYKTPTPFNKTPKPRGSD